MKLYIHSPRRYSPPDEVQIVQMKDEKLWVAQRHTELLFSQIDSLAEGSQCAQCQPMENG